MKKNIGSIDRVTRITAGILLIGTGLVLKSWWGAVGIIPLATAFVRWCPAYTIFGLNTCRNGSCDTDGGRFTPLDKAPGA